MFDDYMNNQNVVYTMIKNSIKLDKVSHAYLIDSNNYSDIDRFIKALIKVLICPYNYSNRDNCGNCVRCERIDKGNDIEIKYIYPDGLSIKKEQLVGLQESFNLSSIEGNRRIYVIWDCDKMNVQASNSILKFLEEPVSNIVAILVSSNIDGLLPTIVSRCQYIKLNIDNFFMDNTVDNVIKILNSCGIHDKCDDIVVDNYIDNILSFVIYFEEHGLDILIYMKKLWYDKFTDRSEYIIGFQLIIQLYYDILKYKLKSKLCFYMDYEVKVIKIANMINLDDVIKKILIFVKYLEMIKYNLNLSLLMDSLIIELGESV